MGDWSEYFEDYPGGEARRRIPIDPKRAEWHTEYRRRQLADREQAKYTTHIHALIEAHTPPALEAVRRSLLNAGDARPATVVGLGPRINEHFGKKLSATTLRRMADQLEHDGFIVPDGNGTGIRYLALPHDRPMSATPNRGAETDRRTALFIDAENVSHRHAAQVIRHSKSVGDLQLRKAYGDFDRPHLKAWLEQLDRLGIRSHSGYRYTAEKNSADRALIEDAAAILGQGRFDSFVIASSDSDFSELARQITGAGVKAYAIGNSNVGARYRKLWRRYFELPSTPTLSHFIEAIRDLQCRDATARNAHMSVANTRATLSALGANVVAKDYGYPNVEALLAAAGFAVEGRGKGAMVRLHDLTASGSRCG